MMALLDDEMEQKMTKQYDGLTPRGSKLTWHWPRWVATRRWSHCQLFDVPPHEIKEWKRQLSVRAADLFGVEAVPEDALVI